ncbi:MAG TPA: efflux RND transporter periplasmic adaptor subunit [Usitatibacteraceae bacterium]|nr:efflux RND transporter periplasmic adaptor subunit [Usitatibacteraceae bacterium]
MDKPFQSAMPLYSTASLLPLAGALLAVVLAGCAEKPKTGTVVRPALAHVVRGAAGLDTDIYAGEIRARRESDHAFRIGGKMVARAVDAGATVRRGQVLARLDPQDVSLALESSAAAATAADTDAAFAESELRRFRDLQQKGFVSQSLLDQKIALANAARARAQAAHAQSEVSRNQAGYAQLVAEFDGVVTQVFTEAGQVVSAGQPVVRIANPAERELLINVPEASIAAFRQGLRADNVRDLRVATSAAPRSYVPARVREVAAAADAVTRTYAVRLALVNPGDAFQLGMSGHAVLASALAADRLSIPLSAVFMKGTSAGVWRISADGTISLKPVTVVQYTENAAIVRGDIAAGDTIVAAGGHKLREGEKVKPVLEPAVTGDGKVAVAPAEPAVPPEQFAARRRP